MPTSDAHAASLGRRTLQLKSVEGSLSVSVNGLTDVAVKSGNPKRATGGPVRGRSVQARVLEEEFSFTTFLGDSVVVRWVPQGTPGLTHEDRMRAREVLRELRAGMRSNQGATLRLVQRLDRALGQPTTL